MKISDISIKRTTIPVVLFTILALAGIFCYSLLNQELTPNMEVPVNVVTTVYPGASPSEVESSVTKKVEEAVSALEGIDKITSQSFESVSIVTIEYNDDINPDLALQECERKVNAIKQDLPEQCEDPQYMKFDVNSFPIMNIAANANIPDQKFFDLINDEVKTKLAQISGVAQVDLVGGNERQIEIKVNADKLAQYNLSLLQVQQIIGASNIDFPTGQVKDNNSKHIVRLSGKFTSLDEIRELIVGGTKNGGIVKLKDIASVVDGAKESSQTARLNGLPTVGINIQKQKEGNAVEISKDVKKVLADFEDQYKSENLKFVIATDTSEFTKEAIDSVMMDLIFAIILVSITMLLFLHTFRNLIFILVSIPTSVVSTFLFFYLFGFSLNLLTLLALSIVIGSIVDDAIVVLENIYRHLEMGKSRIQASLDATKEIGLTVISITLVLIAVFLPVGLTSGITGQLLRSFSLTIVVSILISLLVSFTLVPLLTSRFGKLKVWKNSGFDRFLKGFERIVDTTEKGLMSILDVVLKHKLVSIVVCTVLLFGSFYLIGGGYIQAEFMDAGDRGEFVMVMELDKSSTLEQTNAYCAKVERELKKYPEVKLIYTKVGSRGSGLSVVETPYAAEFVVKLVDKKQRDMSTKLLSVKMKNGLISKFAGPKFSTVEISMLGTTSTPLEMYVRSVHFNDAIEFSKKVTEILRGIGGTGDVESSVEEGTKEYVVNFNRDKLSKMGLTIGEIGSQMYMAYEGNRDLTFRDGNNEYDIYVSLDEFDKENKEDIENISFKNARGQLVKLSQVAEITEGESPTGLTRFNKIPAVKITGNIIGKTIGTVGTELKEKIDKIGVPAGVDVYYAGQMEQQADSFGSLIIALLASVIFMYLIMVGLYDSYVYPLVVMLSLPLSLIGAFLALGLAGKTLSLFSIMGVIMLMGLVAKNAILVVDFANELQQEGKKALDAIKIATATRYRPILMTNLSLIVGLLPLALASGAGAEWKTGLGWVLIGGLTGSMFLSFLVVPVLYLIFDRFALKNNTADTVKELHVEKYDKVMN